MMMLAPLGPMFTVGLTAWGPVRPALKVHGRFLLESPPGQCSGRLSRNVGGRGDAVTVSARAVALGGGRSPPALF